MEEITERGIQYSEYKDYEIVFTDHAKKRCEEINKRPDFIIDKIKVADIVKKTWGQRWWERKRHGKTAMTLRNGHYEFVCKPLQEDPRYDWKNVLLIITVINLNLRKAK